MRSLLLALGLLLAGASCPVASTLSQTDGDQHPLHDGDATGQAVSVALFSSLERLSRLVDISYCVGNTGVSPPFSCVSRCKEFPAMELVTTWNTGMLMSDSCGYIAVDHGDRKINSTTGGLTTTGNKDDGAIVVAFRGTYSITNTVIDLSTVPQEYVPYPEPDDGDEEGDNTYPDPEKRERCTNCTVHMGFLKSWRNARSLVLPALKKARAEHPSYPIQLVGHSLGGAVAALAALEFKVALGWDDIKITTFGEPRVGNQGLVDFIDRVFGMEKDEGFDKDLEKRIYQRVTHANDPVPLLPLTEWGYRAHAGEIYITKEPLSPSPEDLRMCRGDNDPSCIAGADSTVNQEELVEIVKEAETMEDSRLEARWEFPARYKLWQLFFAHRDYFWRLGLCVPGGDPWDWGREKYNYTSGSDEL
ncbi:uncharacterized protein E0L32_003589 [Thyridium curvatum]|uniref:Fungal lipase-type domain-containing protein n=1 Tax=Thyridium curvatum TaxID=1093900 RepID=A0A507BJ09_9PEZI|nr:uncharacterized protein E0L32_003589 [Thyridium curvatum]TPX16648.1 hypothetical protein E0L32_003589 [Thyridium curvatum]